MIRFDKFTQKAQEAVQGAQTLAAEQSHQQVHPMHLLVALAEEKEGVVGAVFDKCGIQRQVDYRFSVFSMHDEFVYHQPSDV